MIVLLDKMDVPGDVEAADSSLLLVLFPSRLTCKRVVVRIRNYSSCLVLSYLPDVLCLIYVYPGHLHASFLCNIHTNPPDY